MGQCSRNWNRSNRRCPTCKVLGPGRRASSSCGLEPTDRFDGILRRCGGRITWRPPRRQQPRLRNDIVNICEDRAVRALLRNDISGRRKLAGVVIHSEVGGRGEGPGGPPPRFSEGISDRAYAMTEKYKDGTAAFTRSMRNRMVQTLLRIKMATEQESLQAIRPL